MRLTSLTPSRVIITTMCTLAVSAVLSGPTARADESDKRTVVTVNQPMQVRNRLLVPGTYVFQVHDAHSDVYTDRFTVEIFNANQTRIIDTILANPAYRVQPTDKSAFTFWETPPGTVRALRDWYYPGDMVGREFPYPKHPVVLSASLNTPAPALTKIPEAAAAPAPVARHEAPAPQTQHTEMAEAAPAPAPAPEPQPAAEPAPATAPAALPKTASPYPAVGLGGVLLVGLYGLMRWRRAMYLR